MSQSLTPGPDGARRGPRAGLRVGSLGFVAMIVILIVAIIFAANQNDVIGWLVVAVAAVDVIVCTSAKRLFLAHC